ncbi:MAG TPA: 1-deoxy-D-xylulose-5-phosphate reductoisomerase [Burkholderiaceae bacterium]|nr:1-deoxy-D-xylulose-5-phosphate reductoisomerase [Burkholderiaceae bacterium]
MTRKTLCVLGSTGTIGENTLDVVARHPDRWAVYALSAHSRIRRLAEQAQETRAAVVIVPDDAAAQTFRGFWPTQQPCPEIRVGAQALVETAADPEVDAVMAAIVGAVGLPSALAAAQAGKRLLLANKEALVAAGALFVDAVRKNGAELLPIDSEHNAIFQCLPQHQQASVPQAPAKEVRRLLLTASGGPFLHTGLDALDQVTPDQACAHPNWRMGRKISVDSATMMNKGLEVIEAHWLFAMPAADIQVLIHPQSVVHSMVEYIDGSILAQLGQPDMRTPIAYGLGFPERIESGVGLMALADLGRLDFNEPDFQRFPCLKLSFDALEAGQAACIALNAANEVAVDCFLRGQVAYTDIAPIIEQSVDKLSARSPSSLASLADILELDAISRRVAGQFCRPGIYS